MSNLCGEGVGLHPLPNAVQDDVRTYLALHCYST